MAASAGALSIYIFINLADILIQCGFLGAFTAEIVTM